MDEEAEQAEVETGGVEDAPQEIDIDPGTMLERVDGWVDGAVRLLPNIGVALLLLVVFWVLGGVARRLVNRQAKQRDRDNLGTILGGFVKSLVVFVGFMLAATVVIPTLKPGDLIAGLGVSSVAIGFAFKDILQNWLAGLLLLLRQPFMNGDQIEVNGMEGTVERIETRATIIKTYDGQRIVIPNSDIYTDAVTVRTAHEFRRSQYDIGIGYGDEVDEACEVIRKAVAGVDGVEDGEGVEVLPWDLAASWVTLRARWWTKSRRADVVKVHAGVIRAVKRALDEAGIDMPYETQVQLLHDQSEAADGVRGEQREGWPTDGGKATRPQWEARARDGEGRTADGHE